MVDHVLSRLRIYTSIGWPIFPCDQFSKKPLTQRGFKDASLGERKILLLIERYPDCAWGTPTGNGKWVLDIDPRNGGNASWERLEAELGELPPTPCTVTGGGGLHYWLAGEPGVRSCKLADGIDLKADGGFVIVPPIANPNPRA